MDKSILVGLDRDGTLHYDNEGYYGRKDNWREELVLCPGVEEGLKLLRQDPRIKLVVASNQGGVAKGVFTEERVREINEYIASKLPVELDDWNFTPYIPPIYAKEWESRGYFDYKKEYVREDCKRKPDISMLVESAGRLGFTLDEFEEIFFIGNWLTDPETALRIGGEGILISDKGYEDNIEEYLALFKIRYGDRFNVVNDFLESAELVMGKI